MMSAWCGGVGAWCVVRLLLTAALLMRSLAKQEPSGAPRCTHRNCQYLGQNGTENHESEKYYYAIEGNEIKISKIRLQSPAYPFLKVECYGASVLESPALPSAETAQNVMLITLENCPLPTTGSLGDTLASLNLTFCEQDPLNRFCEMQILNLPAAPPLAATHFAGLEKTQLITINANALASPERGFLLPLRSLRSLSVSRIQLPVSELDDPPPSLATLVISDSGIERLPDALRTLTNLTELVIVDAVTPLDAGAVLPEMRVLSLVSPSTTLRLDAAPTLQTLELFNWAEPLPPPVTRCAALAELYLYAPAMHALPDGWLASCSLLDRLRILAPQNLTALPPTLFSPGSPLSLFTLSRSAVETLPIMLLHNVRSLKSLELDRNRLQTLSVDSFANLYSLTELNLSSNDLDGSVLDALAGKTWGKPTHPWFSELDLSDNPRIGDVCGADGYSSLRDVTSLKKLDLSSTGVSRICRDWRQNMAQLELLDLSNSNVEELSFEDLQYARSVKAVVRLWDAPVTAVRVTREDYIKAVETPPGLTSVEVEVEAELQCDCSLYWTRRALEHPLAQHSLPGIRELRCVGGRLVRDVPAEELVCGARGECAAAALPAACACAARPADDPLQARWLVRARCQNTSQGFVPRRMYPFYPSYRPNNDGFYLTDSIPSLK